MNYDEKLNLVLTLYYSIGERLELLEEITNQSNAEIKKSTIVEQETKDRILFGETFLEETNTLMERFDKLLAELIAEEKMEKE